MSIGTTLRKTCIILASATLVLAALPAVAQETSPEQDPLFKRDSLLERDPLLEQDPLRDPDEPLLRRDRLTSDPLLDRDPVVERDPPLDPDDPLLRRDPLADDPLADDPLLDRGPVVERDPLQAPDPLQEPAGMQSQERLLERYSRPRPAVPEGEEGFPRRDSSDRIVTLALSSWLPPQHPIVVNVIRPWAQQVEGGTDGRVKVRILDKPLGPPSAHYEMAKDGVADITYGLHSFAEDDRFLRSRIGQFSFLGDSATRASIAYWRMYGERLQAQREHEGVKLLGLFVHGPGMFHNNQRKIETPEDFRGLKIRTPGGYIDDLAEDLGVTTQIIGPGQVSEKLSGGAIDGVTFPLEALQAFELADQLKYSMRIPGGIYNSTWFLVMNFDKWKQITIGDKVAIDAISGPALASLAGYAWDKADAAAAAFVAEAGVEVYDAAPVVVNAIREAAVKREAEWAAQVAAQGFDGKAALERFRALTRPDQ